MARKTLSLRRDDQCVSCGAALSAGTTAEWDGAARTVTCLSCVERRAAQAGGDVQLAAPPEAEPPIDAGTPGASARKEHARRQAKRERELEERWGTGRIGKLAKALSVEPQHTKAWADGASGEERVAEVLEHRLAGTAVILHDRRVPRTRGNIDHLVVAPSGVWIVDAKRYQGKKVERRDVGGWFRTDVRLYVGGLDQTKKVDGLGWQADAVRAALDDADVPIHCALSFVDAQWPLLFAKPFQINGVWVSWPLKLAELMAAPGPLHPEEVAVIGRRLAERLPGHRA